MNMMTVHTFTLNIATAVVGDVGHVPEVMVIKLLLLLFLEPLAKIEHHGLVNPWLR